jgi:hypothetical protein
MMFKKLFPMIGVVAPIVMHFMVMSVVLVLVLLNIKYGIEFELMSTNYFHLVDSVYDMVYLLYFCSVVSFIILYLSYVFLLRWINKARA